jgi:hypothetical protein
MATQETTSEFNKPLTSGQRIEAVKISDKPNTLLSKRLGILGLK